MLSPDHLFRFPNSQYQCWLTDGAPRVNAALAPTNNPYTLRSPDARTTSHCFAPTQANGGSHRARASVAVVPVGTRLPLEQQRTGTVLELVYTGREQRSTYLPTRFNLS